MLTGAFFVKRQAQARMLLHLCTHYIEYLSIAEDIQLVILELLASGGLLCLNILYSARSCIVVIYNMYRTLV